MSENVAEKGPLDGPVFSAAQHDLEVGFGMENAQNQHIAQRGGVQLHLPKPPGTPFVDDNMRMVTASPQGGGGCPRNSDKRYKSFASGRLIAKGDFPGEIHGRNAVLCRNCKSRGIFANFFGSRSPS